MAEKKRTIPRSTPISYKSKLLDKQFLLSNCKQVKNIQQWLDRKDRKIFYVLLFKSCITVRAAMLQTCIDSSDPFVYYIDHSRAT